MTKKNYQPQMKYDKANTFKFGIKLNRKTDTDIIEYLNTLDNKQGTVKQLIRDEIERSKGN